jgi:hypothetical protein
VVAGGAAGPGVAGHVAPRGSARAAAGAGAEGAGAAAGAGAAGNGGAAGGVAAVVGAGATGAGGAVVACASFLKSRRRLASSSIIRCCCCRSASTPSSCRFRLEVRTRPMIGSTNGADASSRKSRVTAVLYLGTSARASQSDSGGCRGVPAAARNDVTDGLRQRRRGTAQRRNAISGLRFAASARSCRELLRFPSCGRSRRPRWPARVLD